jgi:hypothetical protein
MSMNFYIMVTSLGCADRVGEVRGHLTNSGPKTPCSQMALDGYSSAHIAERILAARRLKAERGLAAVAVISVSIRIGARCATLFQLPAERNLHCSDSPALTAWAYVRSYQSGQTVGAPGLPQALRQALRTCLR